jgi:tRNA pseudouridine55 synthase
VIEGLLLVDKPPGPTSHDVVAALRRAASQKRVGHAGTLDPAATGLLVVLMGRVTRLAGAFSDQAKRYMAVVELGAATDTGDADGRVTETGPVPSLGFDEVKAAVVGLVGERRHRPPAYSAIKVSGRPLYAFARKGEVPTEVAERTIRVHTASLISVELPRLTVELDVSKGTYVRVLAEELGASLGVPAHLQALRRTGSGAFVIAGATPLEQLLEGGRERIAAALVDLESTYPGIARARASEAALLSVTHGKALPAAELDLIDPPAADVLVLFKGKAIAWYVEQDGVYRPRAVLVSGLEEVA